MRYGYPDDDWEMTKEKAREVLIPYAKARKGRFISYSELAAKIGPIRFNERDPIFHFMLGELSTEEDEAGRGLLTVLVVHKNGDQIPGRGFFDLASSRGRGVIYEDNKHECWARELTRVQKAWQQNAED